MPKIEAISDDVKDIMRKRHWISFPAQSSWGEKAPLEVVHTIICGQMRIPSFNQHRVTVTFSHIWVIFREGTGFNF